MEDNAKMIETLIQRTAEYSKTSLELLKLKAIDKTSDVVSTLLPQAVGFLFLLSFMLFLNLGIALWIGEILHSTCYGFFVVAAFYGIVGIFFRVVMRKWLKRRVCNCFIKNVLN